MELVIGSLIYIVNRKEQVDGLYYICLMAKLLKRGHTVPVSEEDYNSIHCGNEFSSEIHFIKKPEETP